MFAISSQALRARSIQMYPKIAFIVSIAADERGIVLQPGLRIRGTTFLILHQGGDVEVVPQGTYEDLCTMSQEEMAKAAEGNGCELPTQADQAALQRIIAKAMPTMQHAMFDGYCFRGPRMLTK